MKTISSKVSDDEAQVIRLRAKEEGISVSEYLRRRATGAGGSAEPPGLVRCEHTGALIFASAPEHPPLTGESVQSMLADFP